jgi:uncharacterized heparinase superfamily protein
VTLPLVRLFWTVRYLRPVQIWGRLLFKWRRPAPEFSPPPPLCVAQGKWIKPALRRASMTGPARFLVLNRTVELDGSKGWNDPDMEKLNLYNLHYFDDLNAVDAGKRVDWHYALIERWISENPPAEGVGWDPYPLSLRMVNWIKWAQSGNRLSSAALHSLAIQARYLARRLEFYLLGNHLFANAKALVFAGCLFEGDEAAVWRQLGMDILSREIPEQLLADGGHFERSTMYHSLALDDMLDLVNLLNAYPDAFDKWSEIVSEWSGLVANMTRWLAAMCHPDGDISFFNDAATGIAPAPGELFSYADRLGIRHEDQMSDRVVWLKASGYIRVQRGDAVLIADVAPIGPDYLPAHAHADTLSFELSVGGKRLVVNSGTSRYGLGKQREYERSTAAHSTMEINNESSSEVWAGFRVGRRAYPFDVAIEESVGGVIISAAHTGYRRLPGHPVHRRQWALGNQSLEVSDSIEGDYSWAVARYFLHPDTEIRTDLGRDSAVLGDTRCHWTSTGANLAIVASQYFPEFGLEVPSSCIELNAAERNIAFHLSWCEASRMESPH